MVNVFMADMRQLNLPALYEAGLIDAFYFLP